MFERLSPDELQDQWEEALSREGLSAEPAADKAKMALLSMHKESGSTEDEKGIVQALRLYWLTRPASFHGEHSLIAKEIENELGLTSGSIDEFLISSIGEEVSRAQRVYQEIKATLLAKTPLLEFHEAQLERRIKTQLKIRLPDWDMREISELMSRQEQYPKIHRPRDPKTNFRYH